MKTESAARRRQAGSLILPPGAEPGAWMLLDLTLIDTSGNSNILLREDLVDAGFPAEFLVE